MLKSTHKAPDSAKSGESPLPPGWTEHKAPTGHSYYYNAETKQSTYTRPAAPVPGSFFIDRSAGSPYFVQEQDSTAFGSKASHGFDQGGHFRGGLSYQCRSRRQREQDRPKRKKVIPGCEPWFLVTTRLGRRFVYDPEKNESFWKFPQDILLATFEMDRKEQESRTVQEGGFSREVATAEPRPDMIALQENSDGNERHSDDGDSYEEVEVTDDEVVDPENMDPNRVPSKRQRTGSNQNQEPSGPVEFNEEDIAYQLAQMGQEYGLDPGEYANGEEEDYDTGLPLSIEDSQALFYDLLSDHAINPYGTWEKIIKEGRIIDDERYIALPSMRARKVAFTAWSTDRIRELNAKRAKEERKDPRISYLQFLDQYATPKLYWPEFKRKYRKDDIMKDSHLSDKEREKLYRDHISRLKLPESQRKTDLKELLKILPLQDLNRDSTLASLPEAMLTDVRLISLPSRTRNSLIEAYISTLVSAPPSTNDLDQSGSNQAETDRKVVEREKRETALRQREKMVQEEKRKVMVALRQGKEMMRVEEREIEEALRVRGREGLMAYMKEQEDREAGKEKQQQP